jgi:hypothetical protein
MVMIQACLLLKDPIQIFYNMKIFTIDHGKVDEHLKDISSKYSVKLAVTLR